MPARCAVTPVRAHFIHTPYTEHSLGVERVMGDHLRSSVAADEWEHGTFVDVFVAANARVRRRAHASVLTTVQIVARRIRMARRGVARILLDAFAIPICKQGDRMALSFVDHRQLLRL